MAKVSATALQIGENPHANSYGQTKQQGPQLSARDLYRLPEERSCRRNNGGNFYTTTEPVFFFSVSKQGYKRGETQTTAVKLKHAQDEAALNTAVVWNTQGLFCERKV